MISKSTNLNILIVFIFSIVMATTTFANSKAQIVQIYASDSKSVQSGETIFINAYYNVLDGSKTTGLGIEIHYNSSYFELLNIDSYQDGYQGGLDKIEDNNTDDDPLTDRVISMAWSSLGYDTWPYLALPIDTLTRLTFKVRNDIPSAQSWINVTTTSTSGANPFEGKNLQLFINSSPNLDINNDGFCDLKDVIQALKNLSKLRN